MCMQAVRGQRCRLVACKWAHLLVNELLESVLFVKLRLGVWLYETFMGTMNP